MTFEIQSYIKTTDQNLRPWIPHTEDQMSAGDCTGFGVTNAEQIDIYRLTGEILDLSAMANYFASRSLFGGQNEDNGSFVRFALQAAESGNVLESAWSSTDMTHINTAPPPDIVASGHNIKITSWEQLKLDPDSYSARQNVINSAIAAGYAVIKESDVNNKFMHETRPLAQQVFNNPDLDQIHQYDNAGKHSTAVVQVFNGNTVSEGQWVFQNGQIWGDNGYGIWNSDSSNDKAYIITGMEIDGKQYDMHYTAERVAVAELYVSLFNRAPEADGLYFWATQIKNGASVESVANAMACTDPALLTYPSNAPSEQLVQTFYHNVLGRAADASGLYFWVDKLQHATFGQVIVEAINIVMHYNGTDALGIESQKLFQNKLALATYEAIMCANEDVQIATDTLHNITSDAASVTAAEISIVGILHHPVMA